MKKDAYEELIVELIKSSAILDHTLDPCKENFIPHNQVSSLCPSVFPSIRPKLGVCLLN